MDKGCFREGILKTEAIVGRHGQKNILFSFPHRCTPIYTQAKNKHERQVNSFKLLCDRYKVLSEFDQTIDIMN